MNTKEIQNKITDLKKADLAAFNAGVKSNFLIDFVRTHLIKEAYIVDETLAKEHIVELNMTVASYIIPSLALLTKEGQYPTLFSKATIVMKDGVIAFNYKINAAGLSNEYREKLNEKLDIKLAIV